MTKLMEWLLAASIVLTVWGAIITNKIENEFTRHHKNVIILAPFIFLVLFGLYAATVVLYRVFTFNNCENAAKELKEEIELARKDLTKRGYVF